MIDRYSIPEIKKIWTDQNKFKTFLEVELKSLEKWSEIGVIPAQDFQKIKSKAKFDLEQIYKIEAETKHDVIAFTRNVSQFLGDEKKWFHYGLTSNDIVDTSYGILIKQANEIIELEIVNFLKILKAKALKYQNMPIIGRTHGIHADITSFGLKWALWYDDMNRNLDRFKQVRKEIEVGKLSGAVGNFANTDPSIEKYVCDAFKLGQTKISTQVIQRDRHANYIFVLSLIASSIEKIAFEIRSLQRTEIGEVQEYFELNQKGSSAMPHKKNPIISENMTGVSRIMKSYVFPTLDNISLWNERDISHSSVERIIIPDATNLITYMLQRYSQTLNNLLVFPDKMVDNIYKTRGIIFSQRILNYLIETKGIYREVAYDYIQKLAIKVYDNLEFNFRDVLKAELNLWMESLNLKVKKSISSKEIDDLFNLDFYLKNVSVIYKKVFE